MPTRSTDPIVAAGQAIQAHMPSLVADIVARFRRELPPLGVHGLDELRDPVLADHTITWISEIATELMARAAQRDMLEPLLSDGKQIYTLLAELHGRQRCRHEWTERAIAHEYVIMREEVTRTLPMGQDDRRAAAAVDAIEHIVAESCTYAMKAFRDARASTTS